MIEELVTTVKILFIRMLFALGGPLADLQNGVLLGIVSWGVPVSIQDLNFALKSKRLN